MDELEVGGIDAGEAQQETMAISTCLVKSTRLNYAHYFLKHHILTINLHIELFFVVSQFSNLHLSFCICFYYLLIDHQPK